MDDERSSRFRVSSFAAVFHSPPLCLYVIQCDYEATIFEDAKMENGPQKGMPRLRRSDELQINKGMKCSLAKRGSVDHATATIGEYREKLNSRGRHKSWVHAEIRSMARIQHRSVRKIGCMKCGYSKHVEVCHVVQLSEWPDETPIAVINSNENIVILCPNCHWEFDHNFLLLDDIRLCSSTDRAAVS